MISKKGCRQKGAGFERELVHLFQEAMPHTKVKRGLQMRAGAECPDVDAAPFWIEAKRMKKANPRAALRQAEADAPAGRVPVAVTRDDREAAIVTLRLTDFLELLEAMNWEV